MSDADRKLAVVDVDTKPAVPCADCADVVRLRAENEELKLRILRLEDRIAELNKGI
jgi:cell division protein FtsB